MHLTAPHDVRSQPTKRARLQGSRLEGASPTCNSVTVDLLVRRCQQNSVLLDEPGSQTLPTRNVFGFVRVSRTAGPASSVVQEFETAL